jgi:hypothetical protein
MELDNGSSSFDKLLGGDWVELDQGGYSLVGTAFDL